MADKKAKCFAVLVSGSRMAIAADMEIAEIIIDALIQADRKREEDYAIALETRIEYTPESEFTIEPIYTKETLFEPIE
jgi:hypothetical protein